MAGSSAWKFHSCPAPVHGCPFWKSSGALWLWLHILPISDAAAHKSLPVSHSALPALICPMVSQRALAFRAFDGLKAIIYLVIESAPLDWPRTGPMGAAPTVIRNISAGGHHGSAGISDNSRRQYDPFATTWWKAMHCIHIRRTQPLLPLHVVVLTPGWKHKLDFALRRSFLCFIRSFAALVAYAGYITWPQVWLIPISLLAIQDRFSPMGGHPYSFWRSSVFTWLWPSSTATIPDRAMYSAHTPYFALAPRSCFRQVHEKSLILVDHDVSTQSLPLLNSSASF